MNNGSIKTFTIVGKSVDSDEAKRTRTFVISAEVTDADREVVVTKGISLENFRALVEPSFKLKTKLRRSVWRWAPRTPAFAR